MFSMWHYIFGFWLAGLSICEVFHFNQEQAKVVKKSPLIIVPGDGGSQAYGSLDTYGQFSIWINIEYFFEFSELMKYFILTYNPQNHTTHDSQYADVFFPGWGETWSIENLDSVAHWSTEYFVNFVNTIIKDPYYVKNKTLRGAPYDFRKAPNENGHFFKNLKILVEETYNISEGRRVMVLGHSMGTLYTINFLKRMTPQWKKKYIRGFIATSGPLAGSVKALKLEASGDNLGIFVDTPLKIRPMQRSFPSSAFLMPNPKLFPADLPLIITPTKNYSAHDYKQFFTDIGFDTGFMMREDTKDIFDPDRDIPQVDEIYCVHGVDIKTTLQLLYKPAGFFRAAFPDQNPTIIYGDGDGTVNMRSLLECTKWPGVVHKTIPNGEHMKIVGMTDYIAFVKDILDKGDSVNL